jgi:HK97 family phage major capsid protein
MKDTITAIVKEALAAHPGATQAPKLFVPPGSTSPVDEIIGEMPKELHQDMDNLMLLSAIMGRKANELSYYGRFKRKAESHLKAISATGSAGSGSDWVPTAFSPTLMEMIRLESKTAGLFPIIKMPSNPYTLPIQIGKMKTFKQPENTANTGQTAIPFGDVAALSGATVLTAVGHSAAVLASKNAQEDDIVPILPFLQKEMIAAFAEGRGDAILNGDSASTHEDSDVTSAQDRRKLFLGLRAMSNDQSYKSSLATFNMDTVRGLRAKMGKFGVRPQDLAIICGVTGFYKLLALKELTTVDKYGTLATILTGELAKLDGIPVIVDENIREDLAVTTAVYGSGATKSVMHVVNRNAFALGERTGQTMQMLKELFALSQQDALLVSERFTFAPIYPIASNKTTWMGSSIECA